MFEESGAKLWLHIAFELVHTQKSEAEAGPTELPPVSCGFFMCHFKLLPHYLFLLDSIFNKSFKMTILIMVNNFL